MENNTTIQNQVVEQAQNNIQELPVENTQEPTNENRAPADIVDDMHRAAMIGEVQNNENVRESIREEARRTIDSEMERIRNENSANLQQAMYDANKEACDCYGFDSAVPKWQVSLMRGGYAVWFVIYWVFATVIICPISVFSKGIKKFIKSSWLSILIGALCYVIIVVGIPLLISFLKSRGIDTSPITGGQ